MLTEIFENSPYEIIALDRSRSEIGQITLFNKLEIVIKHTDVGVWKIDGAEGDFNLFYWRGGIKIQRNKKTIFTGMMREDDYELEDDGKEKVTVPGDCDNAFLKRRLAYPVALGPPYTSQEYDEQVGVAETVGKYYVNANLGPSATLARQEGVAIAPDLGRGNAVQISARFETLLEILQKISLLDNNSGFRIIDKEFEYYPVVDKTSTVEFSKGLGNLIKCKYSVKVPKSNYVVAGGSGEGASRVFWEGGSPLSIARYGRIEKFVNEGSTTDIDILQQKIDEQLEEDADVFSLTFSAQDVDGVKLQDDYWIGDKIRVIVKNQSIDGVIQQIKITLDENGEKIEPSITSPYKNLRYLASLRDDVKNLAARIGLLERY